MSQFSTELRYIPKDRYDLAMSYYPIFNEDYRVVLNDLIWNHFWRHEICIEAVDEFLRLMTTTMREIMGLYNQYYNSELLTYDPFIEYSKEMTQDTDEVNIILDSVKELLDEKRDTTNNTDSIASSNLIEDTEYSEDSDTINSVSNNSEKNNSTKGVGSNTPAKLLAIGTIESNVFASNATIDESSEDVIDTSNTIDENKRKGTNQNESTSTTNNEAETITADNKINDNVKDTETNSTKNQEIKTVESGNTTSKTKLLIELRESFIDVDSMILNDSELNECFMQIYE